MLVVTVDGLAPRFVDDLLERDTLPTFRRLQDGGSFTHNARSDYTHTVTLPNHTSLFTGRPVSVVEDEPPDTHHGYVSNTTPSPDTTLHNGGNPELEYVAGVFDVVHDHGLSTCLFSGKDKFSIFTQSWNSANGAVDRVPPNDGKAKIDVPLILHDDSPGLLGAVLGQLTGSPCRLTFLHFTDTDPGGHNFGWGSPEWLELVQRVDAWLGQILDTLLATPRLRDRFALIVTADHGGAGYSHVDASNPDNYTIPLYVFGPGFPGGTDLYATFAGQRANPGSTRPDYSAANQPLRNGDVANIALSLLGLPQLEDSLMRDLVLPPE